MQSSNWIGNWTAIGECQEQLISAPVITDMTMEWNWLVGVDDLLSIHLGIIDSIDGSSLLEMI